MNWSFVCISIYFICVFIISRNGCELWIDAAKIDIVIHLATDGAAGAAL